MAAVLALLLAILSPALHAARMRSRLVRVHSDLRQITLALDAYVLNNGDKLPPTRCACGTLVNHQLPVELAHQRYLPKCPSKIPQAHFEDFLNPGSTYKYVAPGPIYFNGALFDAPDKPFQPRSKVWVPDDFPRSERLTGRWYHSFPDEPPSPVRYAVWSMGPDPRSVKFPRIEGSDHVDDWKMPVPRRYWMLRTGDTGVITHIRTRTGLMVRSP